MKKVQIKQIYYETLANTIIKNLNKRQMEGFYCSDRTSALSKVLELIPEGASVGWGFFMLWTAKCVSYNWNE